MKNGPETILCQIPEIEQYVYCNSGFEPDDLRRVSKALSRAGATLSDLEHAIREIAGKARASEGGGMRAALGALALGRGIPVFPCNRQSVR